MAFQDGGEVFVSPWTLEQIQDGSHVSMFFKDMRAVPRFADTESDTYPTEIFGTQDNVFLHTKKAVAIALNYKEEITQARLSIEDILSMLWVHDIPEIETGDVGKLAKTKQPTLAIELSAAEELLTTDDNELYYRFFDFKVAELFLGKRFGEEQERLLPKPEALIAKAVDLYEGNHTFFRIVDTFLETNDPSPVSESLIKLGHDYLTRKSEQYLRNLRELPEDDSYLFVITYIRNLFTKHIAQVHEQYSAFLTD